MNGFKLFNMMYVKLMKIKKVCVDQRTDQQRKTESHHEEKELRFRKKKHDVIEKKISNKTMLSKVKFQ